MLLDGARLVGGVAAAFAACHIGGILSQFAWLGHALATTWAAGLARPWRRRSGLGTCSVSSPAPSPVAGSSTSNFIRQLKLPAPCSARRCVSVDANGDGNVDYTEFLVMLKNPNA